MWVIPFKKQSRASLSGSAFFLGAGEDSDETNKELEALLVPQGEDRVNVSTQGNVYEGRTHHRSNHGQQEGQSQRHRLGPSHDSVFHKSGRQIPISDAKAESRTGQTDSSAEITQTELLTR